MRQATALVPFAMLLGALGLAHEVGCGGRTGLNLLASESSAGGPSSSGARSASSSGSGSGTSSTGVSASGSATSSSGPRTSGSLTSSTRASSSTATSSHESDAGIRRDAGGCDASGSSGACGCPASDPGSGSCASNGLVCAYPSGSCTCTNGCPPGSCCPITCAELGFPCTIAGDGCGNILNNCRVCPAGQTCEVDRTCGPTTDGGCVPRACPSTACGVIDDGCGGQIDCGGCYWACETGSGSGSGPSTCPASCPPGQIVVSWDDWSPGYPGTSGCGCTPDPCPDAGISCSCATACEHLDHGLCCDWAGTTLYCNSCG